MKNMKKILALVVAVLMIAASVRAFAADNGSITVTNAEIGKTYELYKLFDATVGAKGETAYSTNKDVTSDTVFNKYFEIKNGNIFKRDALTEAALKTEEFRNWALSFGTKVGDTVTADSTTVAFTGIPFGYYFVKTNTGATLTVDSANPNASVIDKNQTVTFDKNIVEGDELVKANQAGLNIDVPFDITVNAKQYDKDEKIFKYVIYDTMDPGWTLNAAPVVKIVIDEQETTLTGGQYTISYKTKANAVTTNIAEAEYFEITIPWTEGGVATGNFLYAANAKINVTYTAKLDPAKAADVKVGDPNLNTAQVKYFKGNDGPDTPSGDLGEKKTKTWETGLTIIKHDGDGNVLTGAQFTLTSTNGTKVSYVYENKYTADANGEYYKLKDGTYTKEAPTGNATHDAVYESTSDKYKLETVAQVMGEGQTASTISSYVGADGTVKFTGLGAGDYKIEETVVPAGYNKADDIQFTINYAIADKTDFDKAAITWTSTNDKVTLNGTTHLFETTVVNNKGTELPSTGGIGTTIFYIGGSILVLAAVILLVTKRRMNADD